MGAKGLAQLTIVGAYSLCVIWLADLFLECGTYVIKFELIGFVCYFF